MAMSNILPTIGIRFENFRPFGRRVATVVFSLLFSSFVLLPSIATHAGTLSIDRQRLSGVEDNTPLSRFSDRPAWDYLHRILRDHSAEEIERNDPETVGFRDLDRQPVEYRGRTVRIKGRLLRCEFLSISREPGPFENEDSTTKYGVYESWILVPDKKDVPILVCSLEIPDGFPQGDDLNESVEATGFFYKRHLFLSSEDEEVVAPTILAKTIRWFPRAKADDTPEESPRSGTLGSAVVIPLACLIVLWIAFRLGYKKMFRRRRREPIRFGNADSSKHGPDEDFDGKILIPEFNGSRNEPGEKKSDEKSGNRPTIIPFLLAAALVLSGDVSISAAEPDTKPIDAEFTKMLLRMDDLDWGTLGDENIPLEQQRDSVVEMMNQLRRFVPASFLRNGISGTFGWMNAQSDFAERGLSLVDDPVQFRGKAFRLKGYVRRVEDVPLNPTEQKSHGIPSVCRCRFVVPGQGCADVLASFVPSEWKRNEPIREPAALTGIFIKRLRFEKTASESEAVRSDDLSFPIRAEMFPLLVTTRIEWFPCTFLGDLGFDVGSFEQVPPLRIADLKKRKIDVAPSLSLLSRNEIVRRAFKFTEADRDPFYGLLKATAATPPGRIEQEARKILKQENRKETSAVSLFNDPAGTRGKPVLLHGVAKRVQTVLVDDPEVQKLYGIKRYYELYLYTEDSRGLPMVVCVSSLPEGMPVGAASDYNEPVSVGAIPYKLWVYESSAELEGGDGYKPSYAPLLVGRAPTWHPREKSVGPPPGGKDSVDMRTTISFSLFFFLLIVWFVFRRVKTRRTIEFKLKK